MKSAKSVTTLSKIVSASASALVRAFLAVMVLALIFVAVAMTARTSKAYPLTERQYDRIDLFNTLVFPMRGTYYDAAAVGRGESIGQMIRLDGYEKNGLAFVTLDLWQDGRITRYFDFPVNDFVVGKLPQMLLQIQLNGKWNRFGTGSVETSDALRIEEIQKDQVYRFSVRMAGHEAKAIPANWVPFDNTTDFKVLTLLRKTPPPRQGVSAWKFIDGKYGAASVCATTLIKPE